MLRYVVRMQTVIRRQQRNCQQRLKLLTMPKLLRISAAEPLFASIKAWLTLMPRLATCRFCAHEYREIVNKIQRIAAAAAVACRKPHRLFCLRSVKNNKNNKKCGKEKPRIFAKYVGNAQWKLEVDSKVHIAGAFLSLSPFPPLYNCAICRNVVHVD